MSSYLEQPQKEMEQLSIFDADTAGGTEMDQILFELRDINLAHVTPLDALNMIYKWQTKLQDLW